MIPAAEFHWSRISLRYTKSIPAKFPLARIDWWLRFLHHHSSKKPRYDNILACRPYFSPQISLSSLPYFLAVLALCWQFNGGRSSILVGLFPREAMSSQKYRRHYGDRAFSRCFDFEALIFFDIDYNTGRWYRHAIVCRTESDAEMQPPS